MGFNFQTTDKIDTLPDAIRLYLPKYVENRIVEFNELKENIEDLNFIRDFCHKVIGSARSYNLYKLEEITNELQKLARNQEPQAIPGLINDYENYLSELNKSI